MADPDADVASSTALLAHSLGYEAAHVVQPADVLEAIVRGRPGLVLLEPQFPGLNISGLLAALRTTPATAKIPVAFFSASKDVAHAAARHRVWATLPKPFTARALSLLLGRALGPSPSLVAEGRERDIEREVRVAFHDLRNQLTAMDNYLALLDGRDDLPLPAQQAVKRLQDLALRLEGKTEHLRGYVLSVMLPSMVAPATAPTRAEPEEASAQPA